MALRKCPRCELNYILDGGNLCTICREEVHGHKHQDDDQGMLCSVCGEAVPMPGQDMCRACLAEFRSTIETAATGTEDDDDAIDTSDLETEPMSSLDELEDLDEGDDDLVLDEEEEMALEAELA